jgi:hypothetical protein
VPLTAPARLRALKPVACFLVLLAAAPARAGEPRPLDGIWITLGPVAAAARVEDEWHSAVGAELSVARVRESALPAAIGVCAGGVRYTGRRGSRFWLEGELGLASPLPFPIGIAAGGAVQIDPVEPPRFGGQATLWFLAGVVPFVRAGAVERSGAFVEVGLMLKIPVRRFP